MPHCFSSSEKADRMTEFLSAWTLATFLLLSRSVSDLPSAGGEISRVCKQYFKISTIKRTDFLSH